MSTWATSVLSLWAAYWAAMLAEVAHLRASDDGVGATAFSWASGGLLAMGFCFFLLAKGL